MPATFSPAPSALSTNQLDAEPSRYLRQHRKQPVWWQTWNERVIAEARALDRPLLVSVGYSACHWCHVMAKDCFDDPDVADTMNRLFVNIKIDREERPDLDLIFQFSLQAMSHPGGWPLTLFLTPDAKPFWGGAYFPRSARPPHLGFAAILERIAEIWRTDRDRVSQQADELAAHVTRWLSFAMPDPPGGAPQMHDTLPATEPSTESANANINPQAGFFEQAIQRLSGLADHEAGGFGGAPKFPQFKLMEFLSGQSGRRSGGPGDSGEAGHVGETGDLAGFVRFTLRQIGRGGLYDHLGGGIARYCVDRAWTTPHFEKMLYDNALYIEALARQIAADQRAERSAGGKGSDWKDSEDGLRLFQSVDWLLRELRLPGGGFAASLDADSDGREGAYYLWTRDDVNATLSDHQAKQLFATYRVVPLAGEAPSGDKPTSGVIVQTDDLPRSIDERDQLDGALKALRRARDHRPRPGRDQKLLADWNGLAIAALADAGLLAGERIWKEEARAAFDCVIQTLAPDGDLAHANGKPPNRHPALLDDLAAMARAALRLHQIAFDPTLVTFALSCFEQAETHYLDQPDGPYRLTSVKHPLPFANPVTALDNPAPSGNSLWLDALTRLHLLTGNPACLKRRDAIIHAFAHEAEKNPAAHGAFLVGASMARSMVRLTLSGSPDTIKFHTFHQALFTLTGARAQLTHIRHYYPSSDDSTPETTSPFGADAATLPPHQPSSGPPAAIATFAGAGSEPFDDPVKACAWIDSHTAR